MKDIVVLGNSVAGIKALAEIREKDKDSRLTVVACEDHYPFRRHLGSDLIAKVIGEESIYFQPKEFYQEQNIQLVFGKKIIRADTKKNRLITEEKEQISFDILIVTDTPQPKFPETKGLNKTGVFTLQRLTGIKDILTILPLVETVAIEADHFTGVLAAQAFRKRGKEVLFVSPQESVLPATADKDTMKGLEKTLEDNGIRLFTQNKVVEILGDGDMKAIRLKSGKVIACQMFIFSDVKPDLRVFEGSTLEMNERIFVNETFRTNLENVYALDQACEGKHLDGLDDYEKSLLHLENEGRTVGCSILGENVTLDQPQRLSSIKVFEQTFDLIQQTTPLTA